MTEKKSPIVLIILDGWGYREEIQHNAVAAASTPVFDRIWNESPHSLIEASGEAVGLPVGQMGNSEIGHTTIGAGKVIDTDLVRIGKAIHSGEFATNPALQKIFAHVRDNDSTLHIQGLVSGGGVHSHHDHLKAILYAAREAGLTKVAIHAFTDGRDVSPQSAHQYLAEVESVLEEIGIGMIATVSGRFYAMDRDNNWDRLARVEAAIFECTGTRINRQKPSAVIANLHQAGLLDEHFEPVVFVDDNGNGCPISHNDGVIFFNFRSDRARMLSRKILDRSAEYNLAFATMTEYDTGFDCFVMFPTLAIETTLAQEIAAVGLRQAHIAETEKFPHATYFLNGGREQPHDGEEHIMLESRKDVPTHDLAPEMRAAGIADAAIDALAAGHDFIFINFANPDMVGHTANVPAIITALETVDRELGRVLAKVSEMGGVAIVTADHGNAEVNFDIASDTKHTAHTINPVPCIAVGYDGKLNNGTLADLAPTVLDFLNIIKPASMTGDSLLTK